MLENELKGIPLGHGATPEEVAQFVLDVATTPFLTGEILFIWHAMFPMMVVFES